MKFGFGMRVTIERGRLALEFETKRDAAKGLGHPEANASPEQVWRTLSAEQRERFERDAAEVQLLESWYRL